ncbi:hypothetical protein C3B79_1048 [Aeromonas hydrophila]|nr:hypothetical protein C3B79_1048 [Aeromonas hydrophila]
MQITFCCLRKPDVNVIYFSFLLFVFNWSNSPDLKTEGDDDELVESTFK